MDAFFDLTKPVPEETSSTGLLQALIRWRFELLLAVLIGHLFVSGMLPNAWAYEHLAWPLSMVLLAVFSAGIFTGRHERFVIIRGVLRLGLVTLPVMVMLHASRPIALTLLSVGYAVFFSAVLYQVMRFLVRPTDMEKVVVASVCGYLLLIEISVFINQSFYYTLPSAFRGMSGHSVPEVYLELVYYSCTTITSIGFGDITPGHHTVRVMSSLFGVVGHLYSVVVIGVLIARYGGGKGERR